MTCSTEFKAEQPDDPDTDRGLFSWLVEAVVVFAVCCFLLRLGVCWLVSVKDPLIIIAVIIVLAYMVISFIRWRKHHDDY